MLTANEVRKQFIDFFVSKHGHTFVPSSSVVPADDPTLMFTNAGMNQFKDVFLGTGTRAYKRAVNTQKCIRVSGKHNDLEEVGRDTYHHTFFEMLGNWSFGDYYKAEAIRWAWELLTKEWGIDKSRLHATVFGGDQQFGLEPDEEAEKLWTQVTDISPSHVHRFGKKDNFWMMGETGPCGPCSEIHIDRTPDKSGSKLVNAGDARVMEIWNLVFIQYNRDDEGKLTLLPAKHVDTGMGFERVTAVLQNKSSNYDTDVFSPIMDAISELTGKKYTAKLEDLTDIAFRVIADHLRMLTFAITDGALPGNKGRGSVLRSVLRRAVRFGWQCFNQREPFIYKLVPALVNHMGEAFPELKKNPQKVSDVLREEEKDFLRTIDKGMVLFFNVADKADKGTKIIDGKTAFDLYQTNGFPLDMTQQMARERGLVVDHDGYKAEQAKHEEISRGKAVEKQSAVKVSGSLPATDDRPKWSGSKSEGKVLGWISGNEFVHQGKLHPRRSAEDNQVGLLLDRTCFYAEAGGQVGDQGTITTPSGVFEVAATFKLGDAIVHLGEVADGFVEVGQTAKLQVSEEREFTRKNHTTTHLLHWALQHVLGSHVEQRGSKVKPDEFTFDFAHNAPLSEQEKGELERLVNEKIYADLPVTWNELPINAAKNLPGVQAFFGDKYGDVVRVVEIHSSPLGPVLGGEGSGVRGPVPAASPLTPNPSPQRGEGRDDVFSREFCGGTHLDHTGQAGFFKIVREEAVGKGVRRLTCVTGREAVHTVQQMDHILADLSGRFHCQPADLPKRIEGLQEEVKKLQQQLKKGVSSDLAGTVDKFLAEAKDVNGVKLIVGELPAAQDEAIRQQIDRLRSKAPSSVMVFGWVPEEGKVQLIVAVAEALTNKVHAGKLVGQLAKVVGGGGGGKPTLAQAGGKEPGKLSEALQMAKELVPQQLGK